MCLDALATLAHDVIHILNADEDDNAKESLEINRMVCAVFFSSCFTIASHARQRNIEWCASSAFGVLSGFYRNLI